MFARTLAPATASLLNKLSRKRWLQHFYLAGGTALALHYGHRQSVDLDFFTAKNIAAPPLLKQLKQTARFELTNQEANTVEGILAGVKVSFITFPYPLRQQPVRFRGWIRLATPLDIALMKLGAITGRNTKKDFLDLYLCLQREQIALKQLLNFLQKQFSGVSYDPYHLYKSLTYFTEADAQAMPKMFTKISWPAVKRFFIQEVKQLTKI